MQDNGTALFFKTAGIGVQIIGLQDPDDIGDTVEGTYCQIEAEKDQQRQKPPGIIHVRHIQIFKNGSGRLPESVDIKGHRLALGDHGADDRG